MNVINNLDVFNNPAQCLNTLVQAWHEYQVIVEQEKTKRRDLESQEKVTLAAIKAKRDILIQYLEQSFDERSENFQRLFHLVDQSLSSGDNQQLAVILEKITTLAQSSPFQAFSDLSMVKTTLKDANHTWEF
jgi:ribonucleotide reductase alpha subunit